MKYFKITITFLLMLCLIFILTACGKNEIADGKYFKDKELDFPYLTVNNGNFCLQRDASKAYKFSASPNEDGEYVYILDEYMKLVIEKKSNTKVNVSIVKRSKGIAATADSVNYKGIKGTYTLE